MSLHLFQVNEHEIPCQHIREYPAATTQRQEDVLNLAVKQYKPLDNLQPELGDVTIIATHANGFPKEVYQPLWDDILGLCKQNGFKIRGIWIADSSHQGASGVLNEELHGDDPSWFDHSRDLLQMVNHFRTDMPRPIVGIGHSMGACELVHLSILHPRLLSTLILIEPVIQTSAPAGPNAALPATYRPDLWNSRTEAESAFRSNKFFQTWDVRVLDEYLKYGLRETPTAVYPLSASVPKDAVTLTTTKHQEAWSYLRSNFEPPDTDSSVDRLLYPDYPEYASQAETKHAFYRPESSMTVQNLPHVRPSVLYVFGQKSYLSSPALQDEKMSLTGTGVGGSGGTKAGKVEKVVIERAGHLAPLEVVGMCADVAAEWLGWQTKQWRADEAEISARRNRRSEQGMLVVSEEWKRMVRKDANVKRTVKEKL